MTADRSPRTASMTTSVAFFSQLLCHSRESPCEQPGSKWAGFLPVSHLSNRRLQFHNAIVSEAYLRPFVLRPRHSRPPDFLILLQPARQQFAAPLEDRIGSRCQMSVDPLQVAHDVEEQFAHLNGLCPVSTRPSEVFFGCAQLDLSKHLLFAEKLAGRPRVFGDEHGRGRSCVADQSVHHFTDLLPADFREADPA